ncbi:hypothetical protein M9Y10_023361 [Tritrichomonas musculus]|uniref:Uncharacterized protein n=1 Tax=Tritrichomonas musculus TaxID=1915356 RepID=A0ABR2KY37_9EUKA
MSEEETRHEPAKLQHPNRFKITHATEQRPMLDIDWFQQSFAYMWNMVTIFLAYIASLFNKFKATLSPLIYVTPDTNLFDSSDTLDDIFGSLRGGNKFLGVYTKEDITQMIKESPIDKKICDLGYKDWYVDFDLSDCFVHYGYIKDPSLPSENMFLGFIICQLGEYKFPPDIPEIAQKILTFRSDLNMLNIRWLSLQNPKAHFTPARPRLPGQQFPGTGLARDAFILFKEAAESQHRDGIVNVPEHFHNAYGYKHFIFLNPERQGIFLRLISDLKKDISEKGLAMVSWAIYLGFCYAVDDLKDNEKSHISNCWVQDGKFVWDSSDQLFPISNRMLAYFSNSIYKSLCKSAYNKSPHFKIDWENAEKQCLYGILHFSEDENSGYKNIQNSTS